MRIAYLTPEYVTESSFYGGVAQYLGRLAPALARRGHDVEVFVPSDVTEDLMRDGVLIHRLRTRRRWRVDLPMGMLSRLGLVRLGGVRSILAKAWTLDRALRRRARAEKFDIVEAMSWLAVGHYAVRHPGAPVIVFAASYEPTLSAARRESVDLNKRLWFRLERTVLQKAAVVYAHSRVLAEDIRQGAGVEARVIPPPFYADWTKEDYSALAQVADWPRFLLFFGKICSYKGCGILADAAAPLLESIPDLRLLLVGRGPLDDAGRKLVDLAARYPDRVRHLGVLKPAQIMPLIRRSTAVVLPSLVENMPNACMESMWKGAVVVGPNGASFDELIEDGGSGILFKLGDADSLRQAVLRAWTLSEDQRRWVGKAAKTKIAAMTPDRAYSDLEELYRSAAALKG